MSNRSLRNTLGNKTCFVLFSGVLTTLILFYVMQLWNSDLNYVFAGGSGDAALERMGIQNLMETGSRNLANRLGGQWGQQLYDYPVFDLLNYGIMRFFALFTSNSAMVLNLFYLVTFPLAGMAAVWALLELGFSRTVSLFSGLLYPFMSYHFRRNENHLLLSAYYMVPLAILVALWIMQGELNPAFSNKNSWRVNLSTNRKFLFSAVICLLISSTGLYYAFFACFFLCIAIVKSLWDSRKYDKKLAGGLFLLGLIILGAIINYIPNLLYHLSGGERVSLIRTREAAELYGLKLIDLFIPTVGHQLGRIRNLVNLYRTIVPSNENATASLGIMGSIGFLILLLTPLLQIKKQTWRIRILKNASILAYAGFLLATIGGVGSIISWLVFSGIRAYNRVSVFLFFLALVSLTVFIEGILWGGMSYEAYIEKHSQSAKPPRFNNLKKFTLKHRKKLVYFLLPVLLLALFDQIPINAVYNYQANSKKDQAIAAYFQSIEAEVPAGSFIYQLPYVAFPEPPVSYGGGPYAHLAGYLNTTTIRWSYGAMQGSASDQWAKWVSEMGAKDMIDTLRQAGYAGIYIDLFKYPDDTLKTLKKQLVDLTGSKPLVSKDKRRVFIKI